MSSADSAHALPNVNHDEVDEHGTQHKVLAKLIDEADNDDGDAAAADDDNSESQDMQEVSSNGPSSPRSDQPGPALASARLSDSVPKRTGSVRFSRQELLPLNPGEATSFADLKDIPSTARVKASSNGLGHGGGGGMGGPRSSFRFGAAKVVPITDTDNRSGSDGQSQASKSTFQGYFRTIHDDKAKEEPSLAILRIVLLCVTILVAGIAVFSMVMSENLIGQGQSAARLDFTEGNRLSALLVRAVCYARLSCILFANMLVMRCCVAAKHYCVQLCLLGVLSSHLLSAGQHLLH